MTQSAPSFSYIDSLSATSETYAASLFNPLPHCSQFLRYGENAVPTAVEQQRTSHNVDFQSPVLHKSGVFSQEPQLVADNFTSSDKVDALELGAGCYLLDQFPALERSPPQLNYSNCLFDETNKFSPVLSAAAAAAAAFMTRNSVNTTVSNNYSSDGTEVTLMRTQQNTRRGGGRKPREIEQETMEILNDEDKDKKAKRRQRNKEAAARCRKRRLDHMNSLQKQVDRLKEENNEKQNTIEHLRREKINLLNLLEHNHCLLPKDINDMNMHRRLASHLELPMLHSTPQQSIMHSLAPSPVTRCESSVSPNGTSGSAYPMSSSVPVAGSFTGNTNDNMLMSSMSSGMPAMYSQLQLNSTSNSIAGTAPSSASSSMSNTSVLSSSSSSNGCHGEDENSSPTGFVISHSNQAVAGNENCLDDSSSRLINGSTFKEELNISSSSPDDVLLRQFNDSTICSMLTDDDPVISEAAYDQQVEKQKMDDTYSRRPTSLLLGQSPFDFNFTTINTPSTGLTTPGMFNVSNEYTFLTQRTMFTPIINGPMILRTSNSPSHSGELRQL